LSKRYAISYSWRNWRSALEIGLKPIQTDFIHRRSGSIDTTSIQEKSYFCIELKTGWKLSSSHLNTTRTAKKTSLIDVYEVRALKPSLYPLNSEIHPVQNRLKVYGRIENLQKMMPWRDALAWKTCNKM